MKNLQNFGVQELNFKESVVLNGGMTDPDGCAGCSAGLALRRWIGNAFDAFVEGYSRGGTHTQYGI
ncbi:hypothetical protein [Polaribacter cellanae]|uniref:Uncharacterized protein n=1 Tax=Polaribacter cellanae TaxID=2818493 RepID=A0A975CPQ2_9FLAO|nr:hypothetical protein [Polaribacter cellanae]QTE22430.1 hypothetical protein J3359_16755 [Polaribacter cellanae]